jgi:hypothetical protein
MEHSTPYEAWHGTQPRLSHLHAFGSLVTARRLGHRPAKLDRHMYHGIFIGYEGSNKNISYIDIHSGCVKNGNRFVIDEAHFTSTSRPPGPQFLFDLGLSSAIPSPDKVIDPLPQIQCAPSPPMSTAIMLPLPSFTCLLPLPLGELNPIPHLSLPSPTDSLKKASSTNRIGLNGNRRNFFNWVNMMPKECLANRVLPHPNVPSSIGFGFTKSKPT